MFFEAPQQVLYAMVYLFCKFIMVEFILYFIIPYMVYTTTTKIVQPFKNPSIAGFSENGYLKLII